MDVIDSQGESSLLIRVLNRLGVCASADTLSRFIQYKAITYNNRMKDLSPQSFIVVSADNIDFMYSYARVFCGKQVSSWHGMTVQAVQPLPSLEIASVGTTSYGNLELLSIQGDMEDVGLHEALPSDRRSCQNTYMGPTSQGGMEDVGLHEALPSYRRSCQSTYMDPTSQGGMEDMGLHEALPSDRRSCQSMYTNPTSQGGMEDVGLHEALPSDRRSCQSMYTDPTSQGGMEDVGLQDVGSLVQGDTCTSTCPAASLGSHK